MIARQLARVVPNDVRQVITLGSPFTGNPHATTVAGLYERHAGEKMDSPFMRRVLEEGRTSPPVPFTAILTRSDGIVAWRNCMEPASDLTENIFVHGSHAGLPINPAALFAIADRLSLSEGAWARYARAG